MPVRYPNGSPEQIARNLEFASVVGLTRIAQAAQAQAKARIASVVSNPAPLTLRAVKLRAATRELPQARVFLQDEAPKGTPPSKYLRALEFGGARRVKRFERALQLLGVLTPGEFAVPADGGSIDLRQGSGGAVGGLYTRVIQGLRNQAGVSDTFTSAVKGARRSRITTRYFRSGALIFERLNPTTVRPVLAVVRAPRYSRTLGFAQTVVTAARLAAPKLMQDAWRRALASKK